MIESNLYPCAHCRKDVEVLGDGWSTTRETVFCPHCAGKMTLEWDENGSGNGWFYFEKEE